MNTIKKTIITIAALSTLAIATAVPAQAGNKWHKPFVKGLGMGVGMGVVGAILQPRQSQTVVVSQPAFQPSCFIQNQHYYDAYNVLRARAVQVCQ